MNSDFDIDAFDHTIPHTNAGYEAFFDQARAEIKRMRKAMQEN